MAKAKRNAKSETVRVSLKGLVEAKVAFDALRAENETLKAALSKAEATIALLKKGTESKAKPSEKASEPRFVKTARKAKAPKGQRKARKAKAAKAARKPRLSVLVTIPSGERVAIAKRSFATSQNLTRFLRNHAARWTDKAAKSFGLTKGSSVTLRVMPSSLGEGVVEQSITLQ